MITEQEQKRIIIISAPSGTGKSTIISSLLKNNPSIQFSISSTTRAPRNYEIDGINYHFLTKEAFERKKDNNEFLEYEFVHNHYYGTSQNAVKDILLKGCYCILDIDVKGAKNLIFKFPYCKSIFITPPNMNILERRLIDRGDTCLKDIQIRMKNAEIEMESAQYFNYLVTNDNLLETIKRVEQIIYETE